MSELFKHRIFIKDGKISHCLERGEYPDDETLNMVGAAVNNGYDSYQDRDYVATLHPPIWKLDDSGQVVQITDEEFEGDETSVKSWSGGSTDFTFDGSDDEIQVQPQKIVIPDSEEIDSS